MRVLLLAVAVMSSGCSLLFPQVNGDGMYTCYTQPRKYYNPQTKQVTWEVDSYEQWEQCPETPIQ